MLLAFDNSRINWTEQNMEPLLERWYTCWVNYYFWYQKFHPSLSASCRWDWVLWNEIRDRWKQQQQQKIAENKVFWKVFVNPLAGAPVGRSRRGLDHRDPDVVVVILVPNLSPDFKNQARLKMSHFIYVMLKLKTKTWVFSSL